jgi:8-oxo-dGTP pyrophosphatase MutT (NUDIX family)
MACCQHRMCQGLPKGVGVCIVDPEKRKVLLGLERFGKYRGKFNICAGSLEPEDEGCAVNAAKRELREEFKLSIADFEKCFCLRRPESFRLVMIGTTPVLVGHLSVDSLRASELTAKMQEAIQDEGLPGTHKEMEAAQWFPCDEHASVAWSRFARVAIKKVLGRIGPRKMDFFF